MDKSDSDKKKKVKLGYLTLLPLILTVIWLLYSYTSTKTESRQNEAAIIIDTTEEEISEEFIKAVIPIIDSADNYIMISDPRDYNIALDAAAGSERRRIFSGRRVNIAVTGVDSRLGTRTKHADANHVISLLIDSGRIEIYSVPRDTYADCGFDDSTGQNKLTVMRAVKGREEYLAQLAEIVKLDKIHYYVEFGFSQAMGLIEFLGYSNAPNTLQVLRSRRGLGGDDFQRVYNQAQFMKQSILRQFEKFEGTIGSLLLRGLLALVETNLTYNISSQLFDDFHKKGFPQSPSDICIYVRPAMPLRYKVYDFTNESTLDNLRRKIENFNIKQQENTSDSITAPIADAASIIKSAIARAVRDSSKNPAASINSLSILFEQKAWYQIDNNELRIKLRNDIADILTHCYKKRKQFDKAESVLSYIEAENNLIYGKKPEINEEK